MFNWKTLVIASALVAGTSAASAARITSSGEVLTQAQQAQQHANAAKAARAFQLRAGADDSTWGLNYDWSCNGTISQVTVYVFSDRTFLDGQGNAGTWTRDDDDVVFTYDNNTVYTGALDADQQHASGDMAGPRKRGCWTADRVD